MRIYCAGEGSHGGGGWGLVGYQGAISVNVVGVAFEHLFDALQQGAESSKSLLPL